MKLRAVKVKPWEEMVEQFGLDSEGDIKCVYCFTTDMEDNLPDDRVLMVDKDNKWVYTDEDYEEFIFFLSKDLFVEGWSDDSITGKCHVCGEPCYNGEGVCSSNCNDIMVDSADFDWEG